MTAASDLYVHTVSVETRTGVDGEWGGDQFAAAVPVECLIAEQIKLIRTLDGSESVSGTQIYANPDAAPVLLPGARVTLPAAAHRPLPVVTVVITTDSIVVGDPRVDGVVAMCE